MNSTFLISVLVILSGVFAASHALLNKRNSKSAFGWIAFLLVLPLLGPLVYLVFGINRLHQRALKAYFTRLGADETQSIFEPADTNFRPISSVGEKVTGKGLRSCDSVEMLENGEAL